MVRPYDNVTIWFAGSFLGDHARSDSGEPPARPYRAISGDHAGSDSDEPPARPYSLFAVRCSLFN
ncbi:MAG: hypothetical protein ACK45E_06765 [Ignavibacteria bacterium]